MSTSYESLVVLLQVFECGPWKGSIFVDNKFIAVPLTLKLI